MSDLVREHVRDVHKEVKVKPYAGGRGKTLVIYQTKYRAYSCGFVYAEVLARDRKGKEYFSNNGARGNFVASNNNGRSYHL